MRGLLSTLQDGRAPSARRQLSRLRREWPIRGATLGSSKHTVFPRDLRQITHDADGRQGRQQVVLPAALNQITMRHGNGNCWHEVVLPRNLGQVAVLVHVDT